MSFISPSISKCTSFLFQNAFIQFAMISRRRYSLSNYIDIDDITFHQNGRAKTTEPIQLVVCISLILVTFPFYLSTLTII